MAESSNVNLNSKDLYCPELFRHAYPALCSYKHVGCRCELINVDVRKIVCTFNLSGVCSFKDNCDFFHFDKLSDQTHDGNDDASKLERTLEIDSSKSEATGPVIEINRLSIDSNEISETSVQDSVSKLQTEDSSREQKKYNATQDQLCSICREKPADKLASSKIACPRKENKVYGLLSECSHVFCLECINRWRNAGRLEQENTAGNINAVNIYQLQPVTTIQIVSTFFPLLPAYQLVMFPTVIEQQQFLLDPVDLGDFEYQDDSLSDDSWPEFDEPVQLPKETTRACPVCRQASFFVIPSSEWVGNGADKEKLIEELKKKRSKKICRNFCSSGKCRLKKNCMFLHPASCSKPVITMLQRMPLCFHEEPFYRVIFPKYAS